MKSPFPYRINYAFLIAAIAVGLDIFFHATLTTPMESFDYFAVKFLIGFSVTILFLDWPSRSDGLPSAFFRGFRQTLVPAVVFTFLMSLYYRWWEFLSGVPYGLRPPDIIFIDRSNPYIFALGWFLAHSVFYLIGWWLASRWLGKPKQNSSPSLNNL